MSGPRTLAALLVLVLTSWDAPGAAQPASAASPPSDARTAVNRARNAFEYRDFERVVALLYPWLHPRRILDQRLAIEARKLLGVSLHVLGRATEAKEEFAELLLLDPRHKLDPFLVPPAVIQAFEDVRAAMRPTLDEILRSRGDAPAKPLPRGPPIRQPVPVPPLAMALLPGGVPQFAADEVGWGLLWAVVQAGFLTLNFVAFDQAGRNQGDSFTVWTGLQFTGLAGFVAAWTASGVQGYAQIKALRARALEPEPAAAGAAMQPWTPPRPSDPAPTGPRLVLGWRF